jgi:hypothetical protein
MMADEAMAVVVLGLGGDGAKRGENESGGKQLFHGAILRSWNQTTARPYGQMQGCGTRNL